MPTSATRDTPTRPLPVNHHLHQHTITMAMSAAALAQAPRCSAASRPAGRPIRAARTPVMAVQQQQSVAHRAGAMATKLLGTAAAAAGGAMPPLLPFHVELLSLIQPLAPTPPVTACPHTAQCCLPAGQLSRARRCAGLLHCRPQAAVWMLVVPQREVSTSHLLPLTLRPGG